MTGTVVVAALAMAAGTALGVLLCRIVGPRLYRPRRLQPDGGGDKGKMGVMDKVLILEAVILVAYTVAALAVFWHTGSEPATLAVLILMVITNIIVEVVKKLTWDKVPTNLLAFIVAMAVTLLAFFAVCRIMAVPVVWYMVAAAIGLGFFVAFAAMFGWDKFRQMLEQITRLENRKE